VDGKAMIQFSSLDGVAQMMESEMGSMAVTDHLKRGHGGVRRRGRGLAPHPHGGGEEGWPGIATVGRGGCPAPARCWRREAGTGP
jgi:hypothetical protein